MSFQILWIFVKQYNEEKKKKSPIETVSKLPRFNNQPAPAPSPAYPPPQPQTIHVKGMSWCSLITGKNKIQALCPT